jgi:hypothetical protein
MRVPSAGLRRCSAVRHANRPGDRREERGDTAIKSLTDLIEKANHWTDPNIPSRRPNLVSTDRDRTLATAANQQTRFTLQTVVFACFAKLDLDAVVYPTGNIPPGLLTSTEEPTVTTAARVRGRTSTAAGSPR